MQEATEYAYRTFKRLMYFTCDHPDRFLPEVNEAITAFENRLVDEQPPVEHTALALMEAGKGSLARAYLTDHSNDAALEALRLGNVQLDSIEARTRLVYGLREPRTDETSRLDYQRVTCRGESFQPPE